MTDHGRVEPDHSPGPAMSHVIDPSPSGSRPGPLTLEKEVTDFEAGDVPSARRRSRVERFMANGHEGHVRVRVASRDCTCRTTLARSTWRGGRCPGRGSAGGGLYDAMARLRRSSTPTSTAPSGHCRARRSPNLGSGNDRWLVPAWLNDTGGRGLLAYHEPVDVGFPLMVRCRVPDLANPYVTHGIRGHASQRRLVRRIAVVVLTGCRTSARQS